MAIPPRDKSFQGLLKDHDFRIALVERRLGVASTSPAPLPPAPPPTWNQVTDKPSGYVDGGVGTQRWIRVARIDGGSVNSGASIEMEFGTGGGYGSSYRYTGRIHFAQRGDNHVEIQVLSDTLPPPVGEATRFHVKQIGTLVFELWAWLSPYNVPLGVKAISTWPNWRDARADILMDSITTADPGGLSVPVVPRVLDKGMIPTGGVQGGTWDYWSRRVNLEVGSKIWRLDGVFTDRFRAYRILYQMWTGTGNGAYFNFRQGGVTNVNPSYTYYNTYGSNVTTLSAGAVINNAAVGYVAQEGAGHSGEITVTEPMYTAGNANQKRLRWHDNNYSPYGQSIGTGVMGGFDQTPFDGFEIRLTKQGEAGIAAGAHSWISVEGLA